MFDTHCHLNFKAFDGKVEVVIERARNAGVNYFVVPGTDVETSKKAVEIAKKFKGVYAAVGIHPHHVYNVILGTPSYSGDSRIDSGPNFAKATMGEQARMTEEQHEIEKLVTNKKVVAVGEVGVDRHYYNKTKHSDYQVNESFIKLQKEFLKAQIELAVKYKKSLILHNREAKKDLLEILNKKWDKQLEGRTVFHCCEPDFVETGHAPSLLEFAKKHKIYIGVDGDITYWKEKQDFVKKIPLKQLVLETDSPFLVPEPFRSQKKFPNEPTNLRLIATFVANVIGVSITNLVKTTEENSKKLFQLP